MSKKSRKGNQAPQQRAKWKDQIQRKAQLEREYRYGQLEPLTDALIQELIYRGWKHATILAAKQSGMLYSRKLNTFAHDVDSIQFAKLRLW